MEISEVRIKLMENSQERLLAFCSITLDGCFVIRDVKIIKGTRGPFVAMPSRKLCDRCPGCGCKNQLRSNFCSHCGRKLEEDRSIKDPDGRAKLYADIAHPINSECRDAIQHAVLQAYEHEQILSRLPGYTCRYDDYGEEGGDYDEASRWDYGHVSTDSAEKRRLDSGTSALMKPHEPSPHAGAGRRQEFHKRADDFGDGVF